MPYRSASQPEPRERLLAQTSSTNCIHPMIYVQLVKHQPGHYRVRSCGGSRDLLSLLPGCLVSLSAAPTLLAGSSAPCLCCDLLCVSLEVLAVGTELLPAPSPSVGDKFATHTSQGSQAGVLLPIPTPGKHSPGSGFQGRTCHCGTKSTETLTTNHEPVKIFMCLGPSAPWGRKNPTPTNPTLLYILYFYYPAVLLRLLMLQSYPT